MANNNNSNNNQNNKPIQQPKPQPKPLNESTKKPNDVIGNSKNDNASNQANNGKKSSTMQTASSLLQQIIDSNKK